MRCLHGHMNERVCHALHFKKGSLVKHRHDDHWDNYCAQRSEFIYPSISCEPVIRESDGLHARLLVSDLKIVGLWETGKSAFFRWWDFKSRRTFLCFSRLKSSKIGSCCRRYKRLLYTDVEYQWLCSSWWVQSNSIQNGLYD